jgi:hypothetical protein
MRKTQNPLITLMISAAESLVLFTEPLISSNRADTDFGYVS